MSKRSARIAGPIIVLLLFGAAGWFLYRELQEHSFADYWRELRSIPRPRLWLAGALTVASYLVLTTHDLLALRYVGRRVPYRRVLLGSFIGYVFSFNLGIGAIGGGAVRYRVYSACGMTGGEAAKAAVFCVLTFWVGFFALGGALFVGCPIKVPHSLDIPFATFLPLGALCLIVLGLYLAAAALRREPLRLGKLELEVPSLRLALGQVLAAIPQLVLIAAVLYAVLAPPERPPFPLFLCIFLAAHAGAVLTHVPGGLGVFEVVMLLLLPAAVSQPAFIGAVIAYRGIYYLGPFLLGLALLVAHEVASRRRRSGR